MSSVNAVILLERLLAAAKSGKLTGVATIAAYADGSLCVDMEGPPVLFHLGASQMMDDCKAASFGGSRLTSAQASSRKLSS